MDDRRILSYIPLAFIMSLIGVTANLLCSPQTLLVSVLNGRLAIWFVGFEGLEADAGCDILFLRWDSCDKLLMIGLLFSFWLLLLVFRSVSDSLILCVCLAACWAAANFAAAATAAAWICCELTLITLLNGLPVEFLRDGGGVVTLRPVDSKFLREPYKDN